MLWLHGSYNVQILIFFNNLNFLLPFQLSQHDLVYTVHRSDLAIQVKRNSDSDNVGFRPLAKQFKRQLNLIHNCTGWNFFVENFIKTSNHILQTILQQSGFNHQPARSNCVVHCNQCRPRSTCISVQYYHNLHCWHHSVIHYQNTTLNLISNWI